MNEIKILGIFLYSTRSGSHWSTEDAMPSRVGIETSDGIDWLLYAGKILCPLLYPWVERIQLETGNQY